MTTILMTLFCQLMVVNSQKIYSLEENLICEIKPCDKEIIQYVYGQETFGDLTGIPFALSFFFYPNGLTDSFIAKILEGAATVVNLKQYSNYSFRISNTEIIYSQQFNLNVWYQIIITEQIIQVCNHLACFSTTHNKTITSSTRFNILNSTSTNFNTISACCIVMYKGIIYPNINQITLYNTKYPEVVVNLNIQEKIQSNITVDYSDYQYIAKLGDIFDYDQYDPYLVDDSLLFNGSQYIQINQITINNQYSFEFRFKQSTTFTSNIILLNYAFPQTSSQIYIFLNGSKITYKLNNQYIQFQLLTSDYTHFCIGITQFLEQSANLQKLYFIQFSDTQTLQILTQNITGFFIVNPAYGYMYIGSKQNQFQSGEYFNLFIFRYYQGFFYDDQHVMDSNCKIYLNDRCIICNSGYLLQNDHSCVLLSCDKTNYDTVLVPSHNQCIRRCHQKCSTCSLADPKICLTCNSIRSSPPGCMCPNYYFEDQVSPNCRKYYPDITVQTGNFFFQCPELSWSNSLQDFNHIQPTLTVYFQQSYKTTPNVLVSLIGQSINATKSYFYSYYSVQSITQQYFTVKFYCQLHFSYFIFNWISTIGTNIPYPPYSSYTQTSSNNFVLTQSNITYNGSNLSPIYQISVWQFQYTSAIYQLKQQALSSTQIKIYSDYLYFYNSQYWNYFYVLYKTYNISSPSLDTQLDDQPKSIQYFLVQRGFTLNSIDRYRYLNNTRTSTYFKLKQQYNESMEIYDWVLILASQQCRNAGPCDFYDSYISNCNLQFEFCSNKTENYYIDSTFNYQLCDSNCKSCFGLSTNCTSCYTDYYTLPQDVALQTKFCSQICDKTCLTCSTTINTLCLSCGQFSTLISTSCTCNSGYYFDNVDTKLCQKCSKMCLTCKNDDKDYCLSCRTIAILTGTTCICPIGKYYDQNTECQQCSTICKTCIDNLSCTSCIDTLQVLQQGSCYCPDKYYIDDTFKCSHCQFPCENCLDQNTCLSCPSDKTLFNYKCICPTSQYLDQNRYCQVCNQLCQTCDGPNENQCLSCNSVRRLTQQNQCQCNKEYYSLNNACLKCSYYCQECDQETKCLTCPQNRQLDEQNTCICSKGFFNKENQQSCESCPNNCAECINYNSCTKCSIHMTLYDEKCKCSDGYYDQSESCLSCDSQQGKYQIICNYKNCTDNVWTPSEECDDGNKIDNDGCTNCKIDKNYQCFNIISQDSICYQCESQCKECKYLQKQILCIQCKDGYYLQNNMCLQCDANCKTCSSFSKCETCPIINTKPNKNNSCPRCDKGTYLYNDKCVSQCGDGIKTDDEQCDDGNSNSSDGCTNLCLIEDSYVCTINQDISNCFYHEKPQLKLHNVIKITDQQYVIQILSNQEVKYKEMKVQVQQQIQESYNFTYYANYSEKNQSFNILLINVTINFTVSFAKEVFQIQVNGDIINKYNQSINQTTIIQEFHNVYILSDLQYETSQRGSELAVQLFYASLGLSIVQLIIGGSESISVMLRTQSYLEYMRFLKIDFPPNFSMLFTYFADCNILKYLDFSFVLNGFFNYKINLNIQQQSDNYLFNNYPISTSFITNVIPFIFTLLQSILLIKLTHLFVYILNKIIVYKHRGKETVSMKIYKVLSLGQKFALKSIKDFKQNGIRELFLISQYAISFSVFIRLKVFEYQSYLDISDLCLDIVFAYFCGKYIFNYNQPRINNLRLINSVVYIFCIVFLQNSQLEQLSIISIQSIIMLNFLLRNKALNIQSIVEEVSFLITFLSSILYIYSPFDIDYITIGFVQFGAIQLTVVFNMIHQLWSLYLQYKHNQSKKVARQIKIKRQIDRESLAFF